MKGMAKVWMALVAAALACSIAPMGGVPNRVAATLAPALRPTQPPAAVLPPTQTPYELPPLDVIMTMIAELPTLPPSATPLSFEPTEAPDQTHLVSSTPAPPPQACIPAGAPVEYGIVVRVVDGDTVIVDIQGIQHTVRYLGIDAPANYPWSEYYGPAAKARNAELTLNRVVRLAADAVDQDEYGQLLRYVLAGDRFVNYELVRYGFARALAASPDVACGGTFLTAEQAARSEVIGMWHIATLPAITNTAAVFPTNTQTAVHTSTPTPTGTQAAGQTSTPTSTATATSTQEAEETGTPTPTSTPTTTATQTQSSE